MIICVSFYLISLLYNWGAQGDGYPDIAMEIALQDQNTVLSLPYPEYDALYEIYASTSGDRWVWNQRQSGIPWNFSGVSDPCLDEWQGISCRCEAVTATLSPTPSISLDISARADKVVALTVFSVNSSANATCTVVALNLPVHNITGSLPPAISNLTNLEIIMLGRNHILSPLPETLAQLQYLKELNLAHNQFSEHIPLFLANLTALTGLYIGGNFFTGQVPDSYYSFPSLLEFDISSNFLTTTLSPFVSNLTHLRSFIIDDNFFFGSIPTTLLSMTNLTALDIGLTGFSGGFPVWICNMTWLHQLDLSYNDYSGTLPMEVSGLTNLTAFYAPGNRFVGPFPEFIGGLTKLSVLDLQDNHYTSTVPLSLFGLNLTAFYIGNNMLDGVFPCELVSSWSNLTILSVYENLFHGHIDKCFVNNSVLSMVELYTNMLSGPLPRIESVWGDLQAYNNMLSGKLSNILPSDVSVIERINVGSNFLTGSLPYQLLNLPNLFYLAINHNYLRNPIILHQNSTNSNLLQLFLDYNCFTGTISPVFANYTNLIEIFLSSNFLTGTVPTALHSLKYLSILLLSNNQLTGTLDSLYDPQTQIYMNSIDVSVNYFTGTIPSNLFNSQSLTGFAASSNCLHGTLPDSICTAKNLLALVLDGISTANKCRHRLFPDSPGLDAFFVKDTLRGTIPACIFSDLHSLHTLHLSGNHLVGSFPTDVRITRGLADLTLSHNRFTGTIPLSMQQKFIPTLDLSFNRFSGVLSSDFVSLFDKSSLFLQVNRLSGSIPSSWKEKQSIAVLEGNIFTCETDRSSLPVNDPLQSIYVCGSDEVNYSVYGWCILCFCGLIVAAVLAYRYARHKKGSSMKDLQLMFMESVSLPTDLPEPSDMHSIQTLFSLFASLRGVFVLLSFLMVAVLMPSYSSLKKDNYTYTHQYGWLVSAVYLQGITSASVMLVLFGLMLLIYLACMHTVAKTHESKSLLTQDDRVRSSNFVSRIWKSSIALFVSSPVILDTEQSAKPAAKTEGGKLSLKFVVLSVLNLMMMIGVNSAYIYVFLNYNATVVTVMQILMAVFKTFWNDVAIWQLVSYLQTNNNSHIQIDADSAAARWNMLALYQFSREDVIFVMLITMVNNTLVPAAVIAFISSSCFYNAIVAAQPVTSKYGIFGCAIYVIIEFLDRPYCLHTHPVYVETKYYPPFQYSYQCASTFYTNYIPVYVFMFIGVGLLLPASKWLVNYYLNVYTSGEPGAAWFSKFVWILPHVYTVPHLVGQSGDRKQAQVPVVLVYTEQTGHVRERQQSTRVSLCEMPLQDVSNVVNDNGQRQSNVFQIEPAEQTVTNGELKPGSQRRYYPLLFKKEKVFVQAMNYLSIILCFGMVYPPLAVIACVAFLTQSYITQYLLVSLFRRCRAADEQLHQHEAVDAQDRSELWPVNSVLSFYSGVLSSQCKGSVTLLAALVYLVLPFTMTLLGYLIFDTAGYAAGWKDGVWSWVLFCAWPLFVIVLYRVFCYNDCVSQHLAMQASLQANNSNNINGCEANPEVTLSPLSVIPPSDLAKGVEMAGPRLT